MVKKKQNEELSVEKVTKTKPGLFSSRLRSTKDVINDTTFFLKALSSDVVSYCMSEADVSKNPDSPLLWFYFCQFGIEDIKGGMDRDTGKKIKLEKGVVRVLEFNYEVIPMSILKTLDIDIIQRLYIQIMNLTFLSDEEEDKLDFTTPSEHKE